LVVSYLLLLTVWLAGPWQWLLSVLPDTWQGELVSLHIVVFGSMPLAYWLAVAWEEGRCQRALAWLWQGAKRRAAKIMRRSGPRLSREERRGRYLDFTLVREGDDCR